MNSKSKRNPDEYLSLQYGLLSSARENCAKQYDDLFRTFCNLDLKAQNTATIAGVQLAAILAFMQKNSLQSLSDKFGLFSSLLLILTIIILVVVIGACIFVMKVRKVPEPFNSIEEIESLENLLALPPHEFNLETCVNHFSDHLKMWKRVIDEMKKVTLKKAVGVEACQWLMAIGLLGTASIFFLLVIALWV